MKNKIAFKLAAYFSSVLLLFAVIIGVVFILLFRNQTISTAKHDLEARAVSISEALSSYVSCTDASGSKGTSGKGMGGNGGSGGNGGNGESGGSGGYGGYGGYLRFIDDIAMTDVWVVDQNLNLIMNGKLSEKAYNYADLPENAEHVVDEVFAGKTTLTEDFSSLLDTPTLTVGTPILIDGEVTGAVLLHSSVEGIYDAAMQGVWVLIISIATALVLSVVLSVFLALAFTKPLNKMKKSALRLADGDYTVKTQVHQKDEIGELAGTIDILSERLQTAKQENDQLDKLRSDFVTNISHELKTPVTVIRGSLEALCDGVVAEPEQVKNYHRQMLAESLSLQRLVNDLLDLSKLQNTDFKIDRQELNLCEILTDAARSAGHLAKAKNISLQQTLDTQSLLVKGDYGRLRQMFLIILDNAVKFSPRDSTVEIALKNGVVTIRDKGPGIAPEDVPHIFDRFYKVKSEENTSGSGLGLAIAKQIADRHGVAVSVKSRPGEGSEFQFTFAQS